MNSTLTNLKHVQLRARAPRALFYAFVLILCLAGLRSILGGPAQATPPRVAAGPSTDWTAAAYAEDFARAYLSWTADEQASDRAERLAPFLADDLDSSGGLRSAKDTAQAVTWTAVLGIRRAGDRQTVTVHVGTTSRPVYLAVTVERTGGGQLLVPAYPAFVGPPATDTRARTRSESRVEDAGLRTVAERALRNYLSASRNDLLADLTDDAVVSLPPDPLRLSGVQDLTWAVEGRRVAAQLTAKDEQGTEMTLRYELDVSKSDRWFVRSIHVDPTFGGGSHP